MGLIMKECCKTCGHYVRDLHYCCQEVMELGKDNFVDPEHKKCKDWIKRREDFWRVMDKILEVE